MAGEIVPSSTRTKMGTAGAIAVAVVFAVIVASWLYLLLAVMNLGGLAMEFRHAFVIFSFGLAILCAVVWLAAQLGIVRLSESIERRIWYTLFAGLFSTLVSVVAGFFGK
jgi:hypothetical protein